MPKSIEPLIGSQDKKITLYANWLPNTYSVMYHANGGLGSVTPTDFTFDEENSLRINTFSKRGYYLEAGAEWNTKPDGTGINYGSEDPVPAKHDPEDERWVEIWNNVFMQYEKHADGTITELPKKNVDTGMGVERTVAILEGVDDNYLTSIWKDIIDKIVEMSNTTYEENPQSIRIIADHIRTAVFISEDSRNRLIKEFIMIIFKGEI